MVLSILYIKTKNTKNYIGENMKISVIIPCYNEELTIKQVIEDIKKYYSECEIYVFDNNFTHLSSLPEFATYKASLIINVNEYDFSLLNNSELNSSNEFIVCIKKWLNQDEILNKILKNTKFNDYEKLLELDSDVESIYYKFL